MFAPTGLGDTGATSNAASGVGAATDVLTAGDLEDAPTHIYIDAGVAKTRLVVWKLQGVGATYLVVKVTKTAKMQDRVMAAIDIALTMLRKVCALSLSLHASSLN